MPTDSTPKTTRVIGYRNPNDFPIQINLSSLGLTLTLPPKAYVIDRKGQKINDPELDKLVRPGGLTRDEGKTEVPIITVQQRPIEEVSQFSFAGTSSPKVDAHGKILEMPAKATGGGSNQKNPVTGYSIEEARRLKLVNTPPNLPPANEPQEDWIVRPNPSMELPNSIAPNQGVPALEEIDLGAGAYVPPASLATVIAAKAPALPAPVAPPAAQGLPEPKLGDKVLEDAQDAAAKTAAAPEPARRKRRTKAEIAAAKAAPGKRSDEPKV